MSTPRHTLYAYVDGSDLHEVAAQLEQRFTEFVSQRQWVCGEAWVVNQQRTDDPSLGPGDLSDWDIGLNLQLPDVGHEPPDWFSDIEAVALFLASLNSTMSRDFVVGVHDRETGFAEDLFFINSSDSNLDELRRFFLGN